MKKPIKKETVKKEKTVKVQKEAKPVKLAPVKKVKYKLLSFEISATIPTQMYGNICPKISIPCHFLSTIPVLHAYCYTNPVKTYCYATFNSVKSLH